MLGLLPAILSQTRRALTKILRLDTDYTTSRASNLDNLDTPISTVDGKVDSINSDVDVAVSTRQAESTTPARVQDGLNANGYTTTVSSRVDTNISNRQAKHTTRGRIEVSGSGTFTVLSVSGNGYLHGMSTFNDTATILIQCDGITVTNVGVGAGSGDIFALGTDGIWYEVNSGGVNTAAPPGVQWEFKSSLFVQHTGPGGGPTIRLTYSLE